MKVFLFCIYEKVRRKTLLNNSAPQSDKAVSLYYHTQNKFSLRSQHRVKFHRKKRYTMSRKKVQENTVFVSNAMAHTNRVLIQPVKETNLINSILFTMLDTYYVE